MKNKNNIEAIKKIDLLIDLYSTLEKYNLVKELKQIKELINKN